MSRGPVGIDSVPTADTRLAAGASDTNPGSLGSPVRILGATSVAPLCSPAPTLDPAVPLVCFSHLRWDFVRQRPQHLMSRFARRRPVWFWEEPIACDHPLAYLEHHPFDVDGVVALRPRLPHAWDAAQRDAGLAGLLAELRERVLRRSPLAWFYTPAMTSFTGALDRVATVYDCMDELSAFRFADARLPALEAELMRQADVVFTGGRSLHEARRARHPDVHLFASSVDVAHFAQARTRGAAASATGGSAGAGEDDVSARRPRLGWFGVIDERLDLALIAEVARRRPQWDFEMVGPVVKIDASALPRAANLHWLGARPYDALPGLLAGWDAALMPFAINDATRFISPTKTPEYLAGGRAVVATPVADVVATWGDCPGVHVAGSADAFTAACDDALSRHPPGGEWLREADARLAATSWDATQAAMERCVAQALARRAAKAAATTAPAPAPGNAARVPSPIPDTDADAAATPTGTTTASLRTSRTPRHCDVMVVGAGFAGAVMAERFASSGRRVMLVERRGRLGGNAADGLDAAGILVHHHGPHIFHTNSRAVVDYLSRFTQWRPYEHRVLAHVRGQLLPMPINRTTLERLFGVALADDAATAAFLAARAEPRAAIRSAEDVVVSSVGQELYELFFRGYTRKQWGLDPSQLDRSVTARVPTRTDRDDRYFQDEFQAMPAAGYTRLFENMLDHERIELQLGREWRDAARDVRAAHVVFTGPIDEFFDHRFGPLPYRSLRFEHETLPVERHQPVGVVNFPDEAVAHTRVTEYKHLTGQRSRVTSISREYPCADGDPYYPVPREANRTLLARYEVLAETRTNVTFVGRLANYRYYNMDQVVAQALATFRRLHDDRDALAAA